MFRKISGIISSILIISLLAGCSLPGLGGGNNEANNTPQTLKVMYSSEDSFYQQYGMLYSALNPNVDIEVISTNSLYNNMNTEEGEEEKTYEELLAEFIEEKKPDVIISDSYSIKKSIEDGLFYDLDSFVSQESYDLEGLGTAVVDYMKELGNGIIYGIPTSIQSQAIYYNKDVFDEYNVPYPTDNMTWTEVIALANMFPTDGEFPDRVYGIGFGWIDSLSTLISSLASAQGLKEFDPETLTMTIDTPAWRDLVEQATKLYNSGTLYTDNILSEYQNNNWESGIDVYSIEPMLNGILAMNIQYSWYLQNLNYSKEYAQNPEDFTDNWDIVSAPVASNGNASQNTWYGNIMSIYSDSTNIDGAWDFISYVTGDEFARVKSYANYGELPIRKKYAIRDSDKNVDAFYATKPMIDNSAMYDYEKIPQRYSSEFYQIQYEEYQKLQDGTATVDEVLATLQLKGNELLATGVMTQEELEKYYEELYGENYMNPRGISVEEVITEEVVDEVVEEVVVEEEVVE